MAATHSHGDDDGHNLVRLSIIFVLRMGDKQNVDDDDERSS